MAWRNVWRNPRRSVVTIAAMALALWIMVLYSGLVDGYLIGMMADVLDHEVGDVQVFAPGYLDDPSLYTTLPAEPVIPALEAAGYRVAPRLMAGGLAASGEQSAGALFYGVDVARDGRALTLSGQIAQGQWLDPADPKGVVLGRRIAKTLGVSPGSELIVLSQATDGSMANDLFHVRGMLEPIGSSTDRSAVFMVEPTFRELLALPAGFHQLIVRIPAGAKLDDATADIARLSPGLDVRSWRRILPTVATMIDSTRAIIFIIFFIVYIAIGILILNAMLIAVFERIREFGVMKAIGVGPWMVIGLISLETAFQAAVAVFVALLLDIPAGMYLAWHGLDVASLAGTSVMGLSMPEVWRATFGVSTVLAPVLILLSIVAAAMLYPAIKAARIQPIEAMRYH
jgi:ABC-type lipoprotein release transport system permease subunit